MPSLGSVVNWLLLVLGGLLILIEVAMGGFAGFDLVLIGSAFVIGAVIGMATQSPAVGLIAAAVLCVLYIVAGRRWMRRRMHRHSLPSNTDSLLGRHGRVIARVAAHEPGRVKVDDEEWRALPAADAAGPFEVGAEIQVAAVDGVTLMVR